MKDLQTKLTQVLAETLDTVSNEEKAALFRKWADDIEMLTTKKPYKINDFKRAAVALYLGHEILGVEHVNGGKWVVLFEDSVRLRQDLGKYLNGHLLVDPLKLFAKQTEIHAISRHDSNSR